MGNEERVIWRQPWRSHSNRSHNGLPLLKGSLSFQGQASVPNRGFRDFRSPGGVWDKYDPEDFYFQNFIASEASREKYWQMSTEMYEPMKKAQPNLAHLAIAELERLGRLDCVITQILTVFIARLEIQKRR
jgi:hypothetical protein